ncbi:MAG TPA: matrixin family metalloprotease [Nocardioidaceae bacterium]|nr:matrixin family metalloprotease [Nocardioidaceae bacterium]
MYRSRATQLVLASAALVTAVGFGVVATPGSTASTAPASGATTESRRGDPDAYKINRLYGDHGPRVGWAHCRRINFRVNYAHAPQRSRWHVREAIHRLERATGMHFRYMGRTSARPNPHGRGYPRSTKLVIGWDGPRSKWLPKGVAGVGGWSAHGDGSIATGFVIVNYRIKMAPGFGRGPRQGVQGTRGQVLMHELGHTVGLGHVQARAQIMYQTATRKLATWGAGDWHGLRRQGRRAGCL